MTKVLSEYEKDKQEKKQLFVRNEFLYFEKSSGIYVLRRGNIKDRTNCFFYLKFNVFNEFVNRYFEDFAHFHDIDVLGLYAFFPIFQLQCKKFQVFGRGFFAIVRLNSYNT